jgi:hypothetical protein
MKIGDVLIAKKTIFMDSDPNCPALIKNKAYTILKINNHNPFDKLFFIKSEYAPIHQWHERNLQKFFYTTKEIRQLKLQKIQ